MVNYLKSENSTELNDGKVSYLKSMKDLSEILKKGVMVYVRDISHSSCDEIKTCLGVEYSHINQIDNSHDIIHYNKNDIFEYVVISNKYFEENKDEILDSFYTLNDKKNFIIYDKHFYDKNRFQKILPTIKEENKRIRINGDVNLDSDIITYLKENFIQCFLNDREISSMYVIGPYTLKDLKKVDSLLISTDTDYSRIKYLNKNTSISILDSGDNNINIEFYKNLIEYAETNCLELSINIELDKISSNDLIDTDILYKQYNYVSLTISDMYETDSIEEYCEQNEKLDEMLSKIKQAPLTPFEKYLAVYDIVKQYKQYKECDEDKDMSRKLKYIMNNDYIVCAGFSKLLVVLLEKVGINACRMHVAVDSSYDDGFTLEDKATEKVGHARVMINMIDEKYDIDGIYMADPTWDNHMKYDLYLHSLMTFEETTSEARMLWLSDDDYIFNNNSKEEFNRKINMLLDKKKESNYKDYQREELAEKFACYSIYNRILKIFRRLDYIFYKYLLSKYKNNDNISDYYEFLDEVGNYVVVKTNNYITGQTIINAAINMKTKLNDLDAFEISNVLESIKFDNSLFYKKKFPLIKNEETGQVIANGQNKFSCEENMEECSSHKRPHTKKWF